MDAVPPRNLEENTRGYGSVVIFQYFWVVLMTESVKEFMVGVAVMLLCNTANPDSRFVE